MNVVLLLWRARLRSSWRAALVLVALIGLGGGVSLSVAAGARRTASANDAILRSTRAPDLSADISADDVSRTEQAVRAVEGVADASIVLGFQPIMPGSSAGFFSLIGEWQDPVILGRPIVTRGRAPTGPNEAMVNERAARSLDLAPGDRIDLALLDESFQNPRAIGLDIVGVGLTADEVIEDQLASVSVLFAPRAFTERHLDQAVWGNVAIRLAPGADVEAIRAALAQDGIILDDSQQEDRVRVQEALRPLLVTLAGLAALAAVATVLVAGQALNRLLRRRNDSSLTAVGCTARQLTAVDLLYAGGIAFGGAVVAAGLAVAASPLFPVGPARRTRVVRGIEIDLAALGLGSVLLAIALVAMVTVGSWRRRAIRTVSPGRAPAALAANPAAATGLRLATAQRGVVVSLAGIAAGLAVAVAAVTFTGSLGRLIADESLVGLSWDLGGRVPFDAVDLEATGEAVAADTGVERATALGYTSVEANGTGTSMAAFQAIKGNPWPPVVAGRPPMADDEVLVGRATLDQLRIGIGDEVTIVIPPGQVTGFSEATEPVTRTFTVVGSAVAPSVGLPGTDTPRLGAGILVAGSALRLPAPVRFPIVLFDLTRETPTSRLVERFPNGLPTQNGTPIEWFTSATPAEVSQSGGARRVLHIAVGALAVAVVSTVVHNLLVAIRQRRRHYAVLKALGFTRRQVRSTVLWQSGALVGLALVLALPTGVAAGRWLWNGFAEDLGIVASPAVPLVLLAGWTVATFLLVQAAATLPASLARRTPLAQTLRSE